MSQQNFHILVLGVVALVFVVVILLLSRRGVISFRYTLGWLSLGTLVLVVGLLLPLIGPIARLFRVGEFTVVAAIAVILLLAVCVQLSISISGLQRQVQKLSEDLALVRVDMEPDDQV